MSPFVGLSSYVPKIEVRYAGDLRRHLVHYDVIVMNPQFLAYINHALHDIQSIFNITFSQNCQLYLTLHDPMHEYA